MTILVPDAELHDQRHITVILRMLLRRHGVPLATAFLTIASVLVSVLVTVVVTVVTGGGEVGPTGLAIAVTVPLIVAPLFTYQILRLAARLDQAEIQLQVLATTDPLTGALNRRHFVALAEKEFARAKRYNGVFSLIIFDVDDFKHVNDTYGHPAGDQVLIALTNICHAESRTSDVFARYGGEEFVFLLPEAGHEHAVNFGERLRNILSAARIKYSAHEIRLTVSMGIATYRTGVISLDNLLTEADDALYRAKREGKNRVAFQPA